MSQMKSKSWKIRRCDGLESTDIGLMPGNLSEAEVVKVLQRLVCRGLTEPEIVAASLRKGSKNYSPLLERNAGRRPISVGDNPHYTAKLES